MSDSAPTEHSKELAQNAAYRLNAEAYEQQVLASKGRPLKQFTPCPKAEELAQVWRADKHFGRAHAQAAITPCACHASLSDSELMAYEHDATFRLAHYAGDRKTLYPRLYRGAA